MEYLIPIIIIIVLIIFASCVKIVPQAHAFVVERLGAYNSTWNTGIHVLIPFIDRIANKVTLKDIVPKLVDDNDFSDILR